MTAVVIVIWLVGAAVTRYSLEQMAYLAPVAVVVVGVTIGIVLFWVKVIRESRRARPEAEALGLDTRGPIPSGAGPMVAPWSPPGSSSRSRSPTSAPSAATLEVSETLATVLVRRGLGDPEAARAFLDAEGIAHDPLLLGDMAAAVERLRVAVAAGRGSACTATTTSTGSVRRLSPS